MTSLGEMTVIVPIRVKSYLSVEGLARWYGSLVDDLEPGEVLQVIFADDSPDLVFHQLDAECASLRITHFRPESEYRSGRNGKMNSVHAAIDRARWNSAMVLDDDFRPSLQALRKFARCLNKCSYVKSMICPREPNMSELVSACGIFITNLLHRDRQYCGHFGIRINDLREIGFPDKDGLFDELVFERHFRNRGKRCCYTACIFLETVSHGFGKFVEQRVRYAYENAAYPRRFCLWLSILPALLLLGRRPWRAGLAFVLLTTLSWLAALFGQIRYGGGRYPPFTWVLAPCWFWTYPIATWLAVLEYVRGGVWFGGQRVRRAC